MKLGYSKKGKDSIQSVREELFEKAKLYSIVGKTFAVLALLTVFLQSQNNLKEFCSVGSIRSLCLGAVSFALSFFYWFFYYVSKKKNRKAKEISNYELIYNLVDRRRVGEYIYEMLPDVSDKSNKKSKWRQILLYLMIREKEVISDDRVKSSYPRDERGYFYTPNEVNVYQEISYRILENCFWNRSLYQKVFKCYGWCVLVLLPLFVTFAVCVALPSIYNDLFLNALLIILSSSLFFSFLETMLSAKEIVSNTDILIKELLSKKIDTAEKFRSVYDAYSQFNLKSPNIPKCLYKKYNSKLNKAWKEMRKTLPTTNVKSAVICVLRIIKLLLDAHGITWAITGSSSQLIRGDVDYCNDIDIIISDRDACKKVNHIFKPFLVEEVVYCHSGDIRSYYGKFNISGVNVDVFSEVSNLTSNLGWVFHPPLTKEDKYFGGDSYPITTSDFNSKVEQIIKSKKII